MTTTAENDHTNPFCSCSTCTCKPMCTCGLDTDHPVSVEGRWDEAQQVMTYVVKLKPRG